jgi:hypothetical protein
MGFVLVADGARESVRLAPVSRGPTDVKPGTGLAPCGYDVRFGGGGRVRVDGPGELGLVQSHWRPGGRTTTIFRVPEGSPGTALELVTGAGTEVEVVTPAASVRASGASFDMAYAPEPDGPGVVRVTPRRGKVRVTDSATGETVTMVPDTR